MACLQACWSVLRAWIFPIKLYKLCVCVYIYIYESQSCLTLCDPMDCTVHGILQAGILEWIPPPGDLPNPGIEPRSPALQVDSLPAEPQGKPKTTGAGSLSLLQQIFPTQELNLGLLHCRQMTYQLSHEGSPYIYMRLATSWTVAHQAPLSMGFSRQVLPFPSHYGWFTLLYGKNQHDIVKQLPSNFLIFLIKKKELARKQGLN